MAMIQPQSATTSSSPSQQQQQHHQSNGNNGNSHGNSGSSSSSSSQRKAESVRHLISNSLSLSSKDQIDRLISEISDLTDIEKLYLYLKLPAGHEDEHSINSLMPSSAKNSKSGSSSSCGTVCISNGGSGGRKAEAEVAQTYCWIRSHLEEDSCYSLPKQEVYEDYRSFCLSCKLDPLCVADFGKAMKQIFPHVKPRRLGQRGNSKYCYSGLKKKFLMQSSILPSIRDDCRAETSSLDEKSTCTTNSSCTIDHLLSGVSPAEILSLIRSEGATVSSQAGASLRSLLEIIMRWAESVTSLHFPSIKDFLSHLSRATGATSASLFRPVMDMMMDQKSNSTGVHRCKPVATVSSNENLRDAQCISATDPQSQSGASVVVTRGRSYTQPALLSRSRSCIESGHDVQRTEAASCRYKKIIPKISVANPAAAGHAAGAAWTVIPATATSCSSTAINCSSSLIDTKSSNKRRHNSSAQRIPTQVIWQEGDAGPTVGEAEDLIEEDSSGRSGSKRQRLASFQSMSRHQNQKLLIRCVPSAGSSSNGSMDSKIATPAGCSLSQQQEQTGSFMLMQQQRLQPLPSQGSKCSDVLLTASTSTEGGSVSADADGGATTVLEIESLQRQQQQHPPPPLLPLQLQISPAPHLLCSVAAAAAAADVDPVARIPVLKSESDPPDNGTSNTPASAEQIQQQHELQLSQLRKLLEQNLPTPAAYKKGFSMNLNNLQVINTGVNDFIQIQRVDQQQEEEAGLMNEGSAFTTGCSTFVLENDQNQAALGSLIQGTQEETADLHQSSDLNSMIHSPVLASVPGSPAIGSAASADSAYMFQPICLTPAHASPLAMMSSSVSGVASAPAHPVMQQQHSLSASCTSSPFVSPRSTPINLRSRNDSGQSTYSALTNTHNSNNNNLNNNTDSMDNNGSKNPSSYQTFDSGVSSISTSPFISPLGTPIPPAAAGQQQHNMNHTGISNSSNNNHNENTHFIRNRSGSGFMAMIQNQKFTSNNNNNTTLNPNRTRHSSGPCGPGHFFSHTPAHLSHQQHQQPPHHHHHVQSSSRPISKSLSHMMFYEGSSSNSQVDLMPVSLPYSTMNPVQRISQQQIHSHPQLRHSLSMDPPVAYHNHTSEPLGSHVGLNHRSRHFSSPFLFGSSSRGDMSPTLSKAHFDTGNSSSSSFLKSYPNHAADHSNHQQQASVASRGQQLDSGHQVSTLNRSHSVPAYEDLSLMRSEPQNGSCVWPLEGELPVESEANSSSCQTVVMMDSLTNSDDPICADYVPESQSTNRNNNSDSSSLSVTSVSHEPLLMLPASGSGSGSPLMPSEQTNFKYKWEKNAAVIIMRKNQQQRNSSNGCSSSGSSMLMPQPQPPSMDQDLQTTLDDLRDCDNDFSRFAQELEATFLETDP